MASQCRSLLVPSLDPAKVPTAESDQGNLTGTGTHCYG